MTSRFSPTVAAPFSGSTARPHPGGLAIIAFTIALWALFIGAVGGPHGAAAPASRGSSFVAAGR